MQTITEQTITATLAAHGVRADSIEQNPATPGEWVVWAGMGHPVYDADGVERLAARLADEA